MPSSMIEGADEYIAEAMRVFSDNLQYIREKREMTYLELAVRAGMTEKNAYQIVKGNQGANVRTVAALARALQIPVADLFIDPLRFKKRYERARPLRPLTVTTVAPSNGKSTSVTEVSPFCKPAAA